MGPGLGVEAVVTVAVWSVGGGRGLAGGSGATLVAAGGLCCGGSVDRGFAGGDVTFRSSTLGSALGGAPVGAGSADCVEVGASDALGAGATGSAGFAATAGLGGGALGIKNQPPPTKPMSVAPANKV